MTSNHAASVVASPRFTDEEYHKESALHVLRPFEDKSTIARFHLDDIGALCKRALYLRSRLSEL